jgi:WD40 repeat protein
VWSIDGQLTIHLTGHKDVVWGALQLANGQILSWSMDKTLILWSINWQLSNILNGHKDYVTSALQLVDGRLISCSADSSIRVWSEDGHFLYSLNGHTAWVSGAIQLTDERLLSWSADKTLKLWSVNKQRVKEPENHIVSYWYLKSFTDGRFLSWPDNGLIKIWASSGKILAQLDEFQNSIAVINKWAEVHGVDVGALYSHDPSTQESPYTRVTDDGRLWVYGVGEFIGDAEFNRVAVSGQTLVVGDEAGRVIFLRVRGGG